MATVGVTALVYVAGVLLLGQVIYNLVVLLASVVFLCLIGWIGYTMYTEPPPLQPKFEELDSLEPETIHPEEGRPLLNAFAKVLDSKIGDGTTVGDFADLRNCRIGKDCQIGAYTRVEENVTIGDRCKIEAYVLVSKGVVIENDVFVGPKVAFLDKDQLPSAPDGNMSPTMVADGAKIGALAVIFPGVRIGRKAEIGAGIVITRNVQDGEIVVVGS